MIKLYHSGSGAADFEILPGGFSEGEVCSLITKVIRVLKARNATRAVEILGSLKLSISEAINHFGDEFHVLSAVVPLNRYEELRLSRGSSDLRESLKAICDVIGELKGGPYIRFVVAEVDFEADPGKEAEERLKETEINRLVYKYIGVENGFLGDLKYQSHREFYIDLDLAIKPDDYPGTTKERFVAILGGSDASTQARILEGVLGRYPIGSSRLRTREAYDQISGWISRLRGTPAVATPRLRTTSEVVERALRDAEELLRTSGAASGVDRVHTALHAYLVAVCSECGVNIEDDEPLPVVMKRLRAGHPAFTDLGPRSDDIMRIVRAFSSIVDALSPLRNRASLVHPNATLLAEPEAMLVVNSVRTLLHYLDSKLRLTVD
ncbi:MAG TPA: abortive infection family protein [Thermoanaerobaculia bacterium]